MIKPITPERYLVTGPKIVIAGGGSAALIAGGLTSYLPDARITVIVSMSDNGGSTGRLRQAFGGLPVGDIRRALSALSATPRAAELFEHRFTVKDNVARVNQLAAELLTEIHTTAGVPYCYAQAILQKSVAALVAELPSLQGHCLGNVVLTVLTRELHSITAAAAIAGKWLSARGRVLPVTEAVNTLHMQDGRKHLVGEEAIDTHVVQDARAARVWLEAASAVTVTTETRKALESAHTILLGPGSLFTSLLPLLEVQGVADAIRQMQMHGGSLTALCNLVATHETQDMNLSNFLRKLQMARGGYRFNHVLYNSDLEGLPSGERPMVFDTSPEGSTDYRAIGAQLALAGKVVPDPNDSVTTRSVVNHRTDVIAEHVRVILPQRKSSVAASVPR